ncbi:AraC family transcriptional regulator [uncultured Acetatifactor sp.]|uniref:AraC family transcriptional regulator n=1 Tax=uncultured Acetatifactor sp. TaxID=1671927 RepID=UPI0026345F0D|nr:AraC family transcriptional regulator [uncultured Acetatifactor sp.]
MKEFQLITTVTCHHKSGTSIPLEKHEQYELIYYRYGLGITTIGDREYTFSSNTFALIPPDIEHDERHQADCELIFTRIQTKERFLTGFFTDNQETIYRIVKSIFDETILQNTSYKEMISLKLNELFIALNRLENSGQTRKQGKNLEYIINYISDNYHGRILFRNLAQQLNFSYDYFQHYFKETTGLSPQQFLIRRRIKAAEAMLAEDSYSCTEIAYRCGFSNSAQFSAIFKREKGLSPQQYRKTTRGG